MTKNKTYYKALPLNIRKKMRQQQEYELYRTFIREITKFDIDTQVEAESEYLMTENKLLYNKLSDNDSFLLDYTPGCFLILGALAKKLPAENKENMPCRNLPFRSRAARNDHKASCTGKGFPASIVHEEKFFRFLSCHSFCSIGKKYCRVFSQACFRAWLCHPHTTL